MRILILGGDGMLGHQLYKHLCSRHEVWATLRQKLDAYQSYGMFDTGNSYAEIDVQVWHRVSSIVDEFRPEAIINAIGIVKQRPDAKDCMASLEINALLPHKLAALAKMTNVRVAHMSTDCVFSGLRGHYTEEDVADAEDLYGKSKFLGELREGRTITLRTSIIGLELGRKTGLIEWFLAQRGKIKGYRRAIYSGLTTAEIARVIERILTSHPELSGVWHVASRPISKYDLLCMLARKLERRDIVIEPDDSFVCDRSLDATRFDGATGYTAPAWDIMLDELAQQIRDREANA